MGFNTELKQKTEEINEIISQYFPEDRNQSGNVQEAMLYSLQSGGKRLRPLMLLEVYRMISKETNLGAEESAKCFACALEMIHTYSLVHDDLPAMDNDLLRRGIPTTHAKYGEAVGILAGDALLNEAFSITASRMCETKDSELIRCVKAQKVLAESAGKDGMILGQQIDLESEGKKTDSKQLLLMYELKTSRLIEAAFVIGTILGGGSDRDIENAYQAASNLGIAFQLKDDLLDMTGDEKKLGKPINSDIRNQKSTYVSLEGIENTSKEVKRLTDEAINCLKKLPGNTGFMECLMRSLIEREY